MSAALALPVAADPFRIAGPAVISFSGGRTSAYMLWRVLQAHGGVLPDDVLACFANTGREMPATLDFVRDCSEAWSVPVRWLEYRWEPGAHGYEEVGHNSASRDGEPFRMMLAGKSMLPNPVMRFCTAELKVRTMSRFIRGEFGWDRWSNVVGLRADEPGRVERATKPKPDQRWQVVCPLADAGIEQLDVFRFWKAQPFDLRLAGAWEGNCDGCFLKSRSALERMLLDHRDRMAWWARMEAGTGATFRADRESYAVMQRTVRSQGRLAFDEREVTIPCDEAGCGV